MHAYHYLCIMNKFHPQLIETRQATVERKSPGLVEIRFKPDVKLDVAGVGEVIQAKRQLCAEGEPDILAVLPPEMDMELTVVSRDHHELFGDCANSRRLALAAQCELNQKLAEIHFRYHPRPHDTGVFLGEEEARAWLEQAPQLN
jgi:hypothetical protein